ncbi:MAG: hypothetical protein CMJ34_10605 [Phycisphaerae bacterium]|nr:hypothetical protein [Phycisphaerae bacterium]
MTLRTTLLRHQPQPGGPEPHFDWLLEPDETDGDPERRDVSTWRCHIRPDRLEIGESAILAPIAPHRRAWLDARIHASRSLSPPLGSATVIDRGVVEPAGTVPLEIRISWSQSTKVHRLRIEESTPGRHVVLRLADPSDSSTPDGSLDPS